MPAQDAAPLRIFLCGDVMIGRGVDQILPDPSEPDLFERWMKSALGYVRLAEARCGPIARPVGFDYVWGDALGLWRREPPDLRIANLETSITRSGDWAAKGINYRMSPGNVGVLQAAGFDCCVLANNHVLDWGRAGLLDTLEALDQAGVARAGAGRTLAEARAPAALEAPGKGRVLVYSLAAPSSGAPSSWAAGPDQPGVNFTDLSAGAAAALAAQVRAARRPGDIVVASIHWGGNWGYTVPEAHRAFARALIAEGGVSIVHGHSSHHPLGVERIGDGAALYGCGDFLNDYEGIEGYAAYRSELVLGYVAEVDPVGGAVTGLEARPFRIARFRLNHASDEEAEWLTRRLDRESARLGVRVCATDGRLRFAWDGAV
jgi:poly-gamma-glutamate capsule biosynthesis protein CapA/YwtB (metallophosphatase superfamily)